MHTVASNGQQRTMKTHRSALTVLSSNVPLGNASREKRRPDTARQGSSVTRSGQLRSTPLAPHGGHLTPRMPHHSARSGMAPSSITPKSSPGSPMEVTPAPSSPASSHATPFRVPSLTPMAKEAPRYLLPPQQADMQGKLTVVFDLDETLVSNRRPGAAPAVARHYLQHMFRLLQGAVEAVLWTASTEDTARPVVEAIDPQRKFFHHVVFRNSRWFTEGVHTKDLQLLGRDLKRVLIVENTPNCCKLNPHNALMVEDFVGDLSRADKTLLYVSRIVRAVAHDVQVQRMCVPSSLRAHANAPASYIVRYDLGLPAAFSRMTKRQIADCLERMDPLHRPPVGRYYYARME